MAHHSMVLSEEDPSHKGFIRKYYATIDVAISGSDWIWCQVDIKGRYVGNASSPHPSEQSAKDDALQILDGDEWR